MKPDGVMMNTWLEGRIAACSPILAAAGLLLAPTLDAQTLTIDDVSVDESAGQAELTVSLSETVGSDVTVSWYTSGGSAGSSTDYLHVPSTPLTIPVGSLTGTVQVSIVDDALGELDELFTVRLSNAQGATIADDRATVTILENDITTLGWDDGSTHLGTSTHSHTDLAPGQHYFKITTQASLNGGWRTALRVTSGDANVYARRGTLPRTNSSDHRSQRVGSDGWVLRPNQYNVNEVWYLLVDVPAAANWQLMTGEVFVQDLGALQFTDSDTDGSYDIGENALPSGSGPLEIGAEGVRFFRQQVPAGVPAWALWLNGSSRSVAVRRNQVPDHDSYQYHDKKQQGQMLLVPPYLGAGSDTYFLSVEGLPGESMELDSSIQEVSDIAFGSTVPGVTPGTEAPYRTYRVTVPIDQLAWDVEITPTAGNPDVAVRQGEVPNEWDNDAVSEAPGSTIDSVTLVPSTLTDGTWYFTVYGDGAFTCDLKQGEPVITDITAIGTTVNDQTNRAGWRFYRVLSQNVGLGWEFELANHVPGTEIAVRDNAVPGRWNYRSGRSEDSDGYSTQGYVEDSSTLGFLQRPGHQSDIWYIGIYTPNQALGAFSLQRSEFMPPTVVLDGSSTAVTDQPGGKWKYFRFDVPVDSNLLGWDLWAKNVAGNIRFEVRRDLLPPGGGYIWGYETGLAERQLHAIE